MLVRPMAAVLVSPLTLPSLVARLAMENRVPVAPKQAVRSAKKIRQALLITSKRTKGDQSLEWNRHGVARQVLSSE